MVGDEYNFAISYGLDVGRTNSFFSNSREEAVSAFEQKLPNCSQGMSFHMGFPEGTTLTIVIAMVSAGAGIVATEFLKHLGEELWHAVRKLILPAKERSKESDDEFVLDFRIGDEYVRASLSDLGNINETDLKRFIEETLPRLFMECSKKLET